MTAKEDSPQDGESVTEEPAQNVAICSRVFSEPTETALIIDDKAGELISVRMENNNLTSSIFFELDEAKEFRDRLDRVIEELDSTE